MIPFGLVGAQLELHQQAGKLGTRLEVEGPLRITATSSPVGRYAPGPHDQDKNNRLNRVRLRQDSPRLTLLLKVDDGQVPNRTDLGPDFQLLGRGYGFRGLKGPDSGLANQHDAGQRLYERCADGEISYSLSGLGRFTLSGFSRDLGDRNPALDATQFDAADPRFNPNGDSSIDFGRNHRQRGLGGEFVANRRFEGFTVNAQLRYGTSRDEFQLTPGSQLALNWMAANQPNLVGPGRFLFEDPFETIPLLDEQGNPVYSLDAGSAFPTLRRDRTFGSARLNFVYPRRWGKLEVNPNVGIVSGRLDHQVQTVLTGGVVMRYRNLYARILRTAEPIEFDSLAYAPLTDRIDPLRITDQAQLEWRDSFFSASLAAITHRNPFETRLAFPGTQLPYAQMVRFDRAVTREFTARYQRDDFTISWTNALTFGQGNDANGIPVVAYPTLQQAAPQNRVSLEYGFKLSRSTKANLRWTYSSGLVGTDVLGDGTRIDSQSFDASLSHGNFWFRATNLLDDRRLISYNQFPGTQFQPGRMFAIGYAAKLR